MNRRVFLPIVGGVVLCAVISFVTARLASRPNHASTQQALPDVYERVKQKGVLRVGFVIVSPTCMRDPNSGKLSGVFVDVLQRAADNLGVKLEWVEEVGWQTMVEGLPGRSDHYDMIGSSVWVSANRARDADFSVPVFYSSVGAYVRSDDSRFDASLAGLNAPDIRVAAIDGEISESIAQQRFPKAKLLTLPQQSDLSQMCLEVVQKRADVVFLEPSIASDFLKTHPGTLKNIAMQKPVQVYPTCFMLPSHDQRFRRMLDAALQELHNKGVVDEILARYEPHRGAYFHRVAPPYESQRSSQ